MADRGNDPGTSHGAGLNRYGIRSVVRDLMFPLLSSLILFAAAQTIDWFWGWLYCILYLAAFGLMDAALVHRNPALLNERGKRKPGIRTWDMASLLLGVITLLAAALVAGLDKRYEWTISFPAAARAVGVLLLIASFAIVAPAMVVNRFFESTVRIEPERGHHVIASGPYAYIRHPGYLGAILFYLATPLILGSWMAFVPALAGVGAYIARTALEDRTLYHELTGYQDYTRRVRYRLLPGVW